MRGIFISYRREDAEGQAGRLFDDLSAHFGRDAVFMDVAGIKKGLDFRRIIAKLACDAGRKQTHTAVRVSGKLTHDTPQATDCLSIPLYLRSSTRLAQNMLVRQTSTSARESGRIRR